MPKRLTLLPPPRSRQNTITDRDAEPKVQAANFGNDQDLDRFGRHTNADGLPRRGAQLLQLTQGDMRMQDECGSNRIKSHKYLHSKQFPNDKNVPWCVAACVGFKYDPSYSLSLTLSAVYQLS